MTLWIDTTPNARGRNYINFKNVIFKKKKKLRNVVHQTMLYRLTTHLSSVQFACLWSFREESFRGKRFEWQPPFSPLSSQCRKKSPKVITWNKQKAQLSQKIFFWKRKTQLVTARQQYLHTDCSGRLSQVSRSGLVWQRGNSILSDDTSRKSTGSSCLTRHTFLFPRN